jgi:hypothetical protein
LSLASNTQSREILCFCLTPRPQLSLFVESSQPLPSH